TGRDETHVRAVEAYFRAQNCFGAPMPGEVDYSRVIALDLATVEPCLAGPKRPQDRVPLAELPARFNDTLARPITAGGYGVSPAPASASSDRAARAPRHGDVVIAAITSCTNTSNPGAMVLAGLLARNAVERGLTIKPWVKATLTPGSRVVSQYL